VRWCGQLLAAAVLLTMVVATAAATGVTAASAAALAPIGTVTTFGDPGIHNPSGITTGPDGNLWFTNMDSDSIGRITPAGVVSTFTGVGISMPLGIAPGPDGNLWFTNYGNDSIGRITPSGVVSNFPTGETGSNPTAIVAGPDGNLWFTNSSGDHPLGRITLSGTVTTFMEPFARGASGIAVGPDGALWVAGTDFSYILRFATDGHMIDWEGVDGTHNPHGIAAGPGGTMWWTNLGSIGRVFPYPFSATYVSPGISGPRAIAAGADGNMWFTDAGRDFIGRITPDGTVTDFPLPGGSVDRIPEAITAGPDGAMWFTDIDNDEIGRIVVANTPDAPTGVAATPADGKATVSWSAPASNGGAAITGYTVTASPGGRSCTWTSGPLSCTLTGLTDGASYTLSVTATNAVGTSAPASASFDLVVATTLAQTVPSPAVRGVTTTVTATVSPAVDGGTVQFRADGAPLGAPVAVVGGVASVDWTPPAVGTVAITSAYSGTDLYTSASAGPDPVVVQPHVDLAASVSLPSGLHPERSWTTVQVGVANVGETTVTADPANVHLVVTVNGTPIASTFTPVSAATKPLYPGGPSGACSSRRSTSPCGFNFRWDHPGAVNAWDDVEIQACYTDSADRISGNDCSTVAPNAGQTIDLGATATIARMPAPAGSAARVRVTVHNYGTSTVAIDPTQIAPRIKLGGVADAAGTLTLNAWLVREPLAPGISRVYTFTWRSPVTVAPGVVQSVDAGIDVPDDVNVANNDVTASFTR
jgi:streptogramin lyase